MKPTVVFQTDFGAGGGGAMAGVVKSVDAEVPVYDFTHSIEAFNVAEAAYELSTVVPFWPAGTVFVSVVDPGVGTERRGCVALLDNGSMVVTPDNGTLTLVCDRIVEVHAIDRSVNRLPGTQNVHIFNGRDVFAYTAARLASGELAPDAVGPAYSVDEVVRCVLTQIEPQIGPGWAEGGIYHIDMAYGSPRINIPNKAFREVAGFAYGDHFRLTVTDGDRVLFEGMGVYERTFGYADETPALLCGDIQPGDAQLLRLNVRDNFVERCAPELKYNRSLAVRYRVRFERCD